MLFGSPSDETKVMPGIQRFVEEHPEVNVSVDYASADNTPDKVDTILSELLGELGREPAVIISGAGMANVLTGVAKTYTNINDLNIGIPITDSKWDGLSSLLSTVEKPPRNAVVATPLNGGSYTAANIAHRFQLQQFGRVVIYDPEHMTTADTVQENFTKYGMETEIVHDSEEINSDDLVVTPYLGYVSEGSILQSIDSILREGTGVQIGFWDTEPDFNEDTSEYLKLMNLPLSTTGYTTAGNKHNVVLAVAQLTRHQPALARFAEEKRIKCVGEDGNTGLQNHPGFYFSGGQKLTGSYVMRNRGES